MPNPKCIELQRLTGAVVDDNPYDIGYWMRVAGQRKPRGKSAFAKLARRGWQQADDELTEEAAITKAGPKQPAKSREEEM